MPTSRAKDLADFIAKQSTDDDSILETGALQLPAGTTAERPTAVSGMIRYNSTLGLSEYYDGTQWKSIDSPPVISSVTPSTFTASGTTITITGSNLQSSAIITVIDSDGTGYTPDSITYVSESSVTFDTTTAITNSEKDYFDVKVTNPSGLSATLSDALQISDGTISWNTASGSHTLFDIDRSSGLDAGVTISGGGGESDLTKTFSLSAGSLPAGASLNTSTGAITGISAVGSDTLSNFTIGVSVADASSGVTTTDTRAFALTVKASVITSYTSTGGFTFSVPTGLTTSNVLVVAAGGGGGRAGGGGAGGLIYRPAFPVTPGGSVSGSVGTGGQGQFGDGGPINSGQNSVFGTLTSLGGGGGAYSAAQGGQGGSGGGAGFNLNASQAAQAVGAGQQPSQPGDSGTYGFGNPGGEGGPNPTYSPGNTGGGGGGAGAKGGTGNQHPDGTSNWAQGGIGKQYDISGSQIYYAGGGSGAGHPGGAEPGSAAQGGGGKAIRAGGSSSDTIATANRGGGGGADHNGPNSIGPYGHGTGGSGIVIVSY